MRPAPPPPQRATRRSAMGRENRRDRMFRDERGSVLIGGLILVLALTLIGVGLFEAAVIETGQVRFTEEDAKALYAAESGLNRAALDMSTNTSGTYWFCDLRGCPLLGVPGDATFQASDTPLALGYASTCFGKPAGTACDGSNNPTQPVYLVEAVRPIDPSAGTPYTNRLLLTSTACMPGPGANPCPAETRAMAQVKAMIKQGPPDATSTTTTTTTVTSTTTTRPGMPFAMFGGSQTC